MLASLGVPSVFIIFMRMFTQTLAAPATTTAHSAALESSEVRRYFCDLELEI